MPIREWTDKQKTAIENRNKTLLVSAAAGSGKTATLIERITRTILDENSPDDIISRMVIVTYTRAAASELKDRITAEIGERIKDDPESPRLKKQLLLLPSARISTISSFCGNLVRENASCLGLSPAFRICESAERELLMIDIMEALIEECFQDTEGELCNGEDFCALVDDLVSVKAEASLSELLLKIYGKTGNFVERVEVLKKYRDSFKTEKDFFDTAAGSVCKQELIEGVKYYQSLYEFYIEKIKESSSAAVLNKHLPAYESDLKFMSRLLSALEKGYDAARAQVNGFEKMPLGSVGAADKDENDSRLQSERKEFVDAWQEMVKALAYTPEQIEKLKTRLYKFHDVLYVFLSEFERRFQQEKASRGICDYADLEHYALELLYENDEPTSLARSLRDYYEYIYIDEYQDINPIQHRVFEAIRREDNTFMVGDIKQSIYSFRRAEPAIFAAMKRAFPKIEDAPNSKAASVFMSSNFRCDEGIINFSNAVFDSLFGMAGESIGYEQADRLEFKKKNEAKKEAILPTVALLLSSRETKARLKSLESEQELEAVDAEGEYVAAEIERLLKEGHLQNGERIKPSDIAVIVRKNDRAHAFTEALIKRGIPYATKAKESIFSSAEMKLALCLLNTVDNPQRDVYLMGLLHSPIYDFSLDELARIRLEGEVGESLYSCLCAYSASHPEFEKGSHFLKQLDKFRKKARGLAVDKLVSYLYEQTGMLTLSGKGSEAGHKKLLFLYNYARQFEASSFKGLYNFICYINETIEKSRSIGEDEELVGDGVKIVTVHYTKGLEFPVCFVTGCGQTLDSRELQSELVYDAEIGFSPKLLERDALVRADNPVRQAIINSIKVKSREEELRVLYVALTRARERLYITGKLSANINNYLEACRLRGHIMSEYTVLHATRECEWILSSIIRSKEKRVCNLLAVCALPDRVESADITDIYLSGEEVNITFGQGDASPEKGGSQNEPEALEKMPPTERDEVRADRKEVEKVSEEEKRQEKIEQLKKEILKRFEATYPQKELLDIPAKLSVSRLSPSLLDESEDLTLSEFQGPDKKKSVSQEMSQKPAERSYTVPQFIEKSQPNSAEKGTATHLFMQFADFKRVKENGAEKELNRLVDDGFISKADAALVFVDELEKFARSEFLEELLSAESIRREFRFNLLLPAEMFAQEKEKKELLQGQELLVQGVIDCIIERKDGSYVIIDYKTDRLTENELVNRKLAEKKLKERYKDQLTYYACACERMYGTAPSEVKLYSLPLGDCISVNISLQ